MVFDGTWVTVDSGSDRGSSPTVKEGSRILSDGIDCEPSLTVGLLPRRLSVA
jgi:hypothetical protein